MEQAIIMLVAAAIGIVNWILKNQQNSGSQPPDPESRGSSRPYSSEESEEERMRKFMEALGLPPTSPPPPLAPRQKEPQDASRTAPPLASPRSLPRPVRQRKPTPAPQKPAPVPVAKSPEPAPVAPVQYQVDLHEQAALRPEAVAANKAASATFPVDTLPSLLRRPESLRTAVILKEILGPPRSLQPEAYRAI